MYICHKNSLIDTPYLYQGQESSVVEHLICTQLSATSRPSPVLGLALHYPPAQLICLLSDFR